MSTQQSINNCVSRIEKQLNSLTPNIELVHTELGFLDKLISLEMNGIVVDTSGLKVQPVRDEVTPGLPKYPKGTVIVIMHDSATKVEEETIISQLRKDQDWESESYYVIKFNDIEKGYEASPYKPSAESTSKYTLHTGEEAYLIKI